MTNDGETDVTAGPAFGFSFDGAGGARALDPGAPGRSDEAGFEWLHFRGDDSDAVGRLSGLGLDQFVIDALTAEETRPRCTVHGEGVILNLRGVNLNPGAELEDMVSVRLWIEKRRVIGVWMRRLHAVGDLVASIDRGEAPVSVGDFTARLALRLADRVEPMIATLNEQIDTLEEQVLTPDAQVPRESLSALRRSAIVLRRFMVPQRDALSTFEIEDFGWLSDRDRLRLREATERITRVGEELDALRDRAQIVHDQIMDQRAERLNKQTLVLSVVASIFLPLGLLTGLLGINVGGIPGADSAWGFWAVCGLLLALGVALVLWVRALGMFR